MNTNCLVCDTPTNNRCSGCKSVYYCSKQHITQNWPAHKGYCKRVRETGTQSFDAILFAANETKPRLIKIPWVFGDVEEDDYPTQWHKLDCQPWLGGKDCFQRTMYVNTLGRKGPSLGHIIGIRYDDNSFINGSPPNQCIWGVTKGQAPHPWAGNLIALRAKSMPTDLYEDAVPETDLEPVIQFFKEYPYRMH